MKDKVLSEGEVKARLAQAEAHFSHYRWNDAIAIFEAVLASHPDHPVATQGWANAVEQKSVDDELKEALAKARAGLAERRFDEALGLLNHAQTRGALSHILKYHSEIDGLRSDAQEGQEWQRRIEAAMAEAEALAGRRRFDQALDVVDETLRPLRARGWERLGEGLAALREKLWAERDVSERVQFAQAAYERQDYRLATELAVALREELPGREDVRRLHERARAAESRVQGRLVAVNEALAEARTDDALALLSGLRAEHPRNPDWQAIALRVHLEQGRAALSTGRARMTERAYEEAAEAFEAAHAAFATVTEIFADHPTASREQAEAAALRQAALAAGQAARDTSAFRWEASRQGWQAGKDQLNAATEARGRDFGEVAAIIDAGLGESEAALAGLEQARLALADGRQALAARDAGAARDAFRAGLSRIDGGGLGDSAHLSELRDGLASGLREAERVQRDVKKLLSQAEAAGRGGERVSLLRRAYERWETAPGLATRLAEELLGAAVASAEAADDDAALAYCEQVGELTAAPVGALGDAQRLAAEVSARRAEKDARAEAAEVAARAEAVDRALSPVTEALGAVEALFEVAADGDLATVDWEAAERSLETARKALASAHSLPQPLPPLWGELGSRVGLLERRNRLLRHAQNLIAAGRKVEAMPALQAYAAGDADAVVLAALGRLARDGSDDAAAAARGWQAQAATALERGELATARAYVELALGYAPFAPHTIPEIRRVERQIGLLTEARDKTREARAALAVNDLRGALACYRAALELTADGEAGLPAEARREIHWVLDREDAADEVNVPAPLLDEAAHPLVREFIAPALARWWRLTRQAAALARIETQVALGRHAAAADVAAELAETYPRDHQMVEAFRSANAEATERQLARWQRRLSRAHRLAEQGAYAEALAEIEPEMFVGGREGGDEAEELAEQAGDLRMSLGGLLKLAEQLWPLLEHMRAAALVGNFDDSLAVRKQAELLDPGRRVGAVWEELDALATLVRQRQAEGGSATAKAVAVVRQDETTPAPGAERITVAAPPPEHPLEPGRPPLSPVEAPLAESRTERPEAAPRASVSDEPPTAQPPKELARPVEPAPAPELEIPAELEVPLVPRAPEPPVSADPDASDPPAPFDLDDWLSNVTELGPDDGEPEIRS